MDTANIVILSGLVIGLIYGLVGLLSGFCLMSSLRGWWAEGDGRLVRSFALAIGVLAFAGYRLLQLRASGAPGPARQVEDLRIYDMAGMLQAKPDLPLTILDAQAPALARFLRQEGRMLYTPALQDPVVFGAKMQLLVAPSQPAVEPQWRALVAAHPLIYLHVRAREFAWLFLQQHPDQCLTYTLGFLGPEKQMKLLGIARRYDDRDDWLEENYAQPLVGTPAFSHTVFALAGLLCLIVLLARRRAADWPIAGMLAASVLYTMSYFFIGVACQYRYLFVTDMTTLAAIFYLSFDYGRGLRRA